VHSETERDRERASTVHHGRITGFFGCHVEKIPNTSFCELTQMGLHEGPDSCLKQHGCKDGVWVILFSLKTVLCNCLKEFIMPSKMHHP
jgi:hypothetical protein